MRCAGKNHPRPNLQQDSREIETDEGTREVDWLSVMRGDANFCPSAILARQDSCTDG